MYLFLIAKIRQEIGILQKVVNSIYAHSMNEERNVTLRYVTSTTYTGVCCICLLIKYLNNQGHKYSDNVLAVC
jgi:hypothetical protein